MSSTSATRSHSSGSNTPPPESKSARNSGRTGDRASLEQPLVKSHSHDTYGSAQGPTSLADINKIGCPQVTGRRIKSALSNPRDALRPAFAALLLQEINGYMGGNSSVSGTATETVEGPGYEISVEVAVHAGATQNTGIIPFTGNLLTLFVGSFFTIALIWQLVTTLKECCGTKKKPDSTEGHEQAQRIKRFESASWWFALAGSGVAIATAALKLFYPGGSEICLSANASLDGKQAISQSDGCAEGALFTTEELLAYACVILYSIATGTGKTGRAVRKEAEKQIRKSHRAPLSANDGNV